MNQKSLFLFCDGASRGNPGKSAIGGVLFWGIKSEIFSLSLNQFKKKEFGTVKYISSYSERIHDTTNNQAEYLSLEYGLEYILNRLKNSKKSIDIIVYMDSQLVVYQVLGKYKVKNYDLKHLYNKVKEWIKQITIKEHNINFRSIPREENTIADYFANQAFEKNAKIVQG